MSLQWTIAACFLYAEIAAIIILLLPFISATRWQSVFKSRLVQGITSYASLYFNVILVALSLFFLDSIREIYKYQKRLSTSNDSIHGSLHHGPSMELVQEFRAQRNFYISGCALFLWFVFKRLLALISSQAQLVAENRAVKNQAESATRAASSLLDSKKDSKSTQGEESSETTKKLKLKEEEVETLSKTLKTARVDLETMKKQSESVSKEYDNLLKEHAKLQAKLEAFEYEKSLGGVEDKKKN